MGKRHDQAHGAGAGTRDNRRECATPHSVPRASRLASVIFQTPWGWMGISETTKGIDAIVLPKSSRQAVRSELQAASVALLDGKPSRRLREAQVQLTAYLAATRHTFELPLDFSRGTSFQRKVWHAVRRVPFGQLRSYRWVAVRVGGSRYSRAVGNAVGANPVPIVVPCHRIVAEDASLGGFSGGLPTKRKLLTLEGSLAQLRPGRS